MMITMADDGFVAKDDEERDGEDDDDTDGGR